MSDQAARAAIVIDFSRGIVRTKALLHAALAGPAMTIAVWCLYASTMRLPLPRRRWVAGQIEAATSLLFPIVNLDPLGECDSLIEAVHENIAVKREILARLAAIAKRGAILSLGPDFAPSPFLARCANEGQTLQ